MPVSSRLNPLSLRKDFGEKTISMLKENAGDVNLLVVQENN